MASDSIYWIIAGVFGVAVAIGVIVLIVMVLKYLVKKTKEDEASAKAELQQIVGALPGDKQAAFFLQYNSKRKNPTTAVVLALLLGGAGIHKFYLGQIGWGIVYLAFCWTYIPGIIAFIEAFTISRTVIQKNREIARESAAILGGNVSTLFQ